ncbi:hypothetical protein [Bradyrhizobium sp. CCGUVB23]|uniref:hypothetical protein n=1 Tax=Bradyrhizobium sp. CCGUVB23 TaxID=2949630 RepID=UPI0020B235D4|nr:hypothetical protein [Bradyrhizobium sp. CCGUVB23]MCP3468313.1 hypothetical protein [Bradyrhizobium sp. CCGUVB23]
MRYAGETLLELVLYEGLFELDRLDRGRRTKFEPQSDLKKLFPLRSGQDVSAKFTTESDGQRGQLHVELAVKGEEQFSVGACKYSVLKIERRQSDTTAHPRLVSVDYYSPELKLILAKAWGSSDLIRFDRIYPLRQPQAEAQTKAKRSQDDAQTTPCRSEQPVNSIPELWPSLAPCWRAPAGTESMEITLVFSLRRNGTLIGKPRISYSKLDGDESLQRAFVASILEALDRALPIPLTDSFANALAGKPLAVRFTSK